MFLQEEWKGTYIKIQTLFKRDEKTHKIIYGDYSKQEFPNIKLYSISEKVDGTNIRITFENNNIKFDGKTDDAQIPARLYSVLQKRFTVDILKNTFIMDKAVIQQDGIEKIEKVLPNKIILFGEGYGAKIHKGGGSYSADPKFILFDAWIDGWWIERNNIADIAKKLDIKYVPEIGLMTIEEAINYVKSSPNSLIAESSRMMEGIVARSHPLMLFRVGTPIIWKLKVKDFKE